MKLNLWGIQIGIYVHISFVLPSSSAACMAIFCSSLSTWWVCTCREYMLGISSAACMAISCSSLSSWWVCTCREKKQCLRAGPFCFVLLHILCCVHGLFFFLSLPSGTLPAGNQSNACVQAPRFLALECCLGTHPPQTPSCPSQSPPPASMIHTRYNGNPQSCILFLISACIAFKPHDRPSLSVPSPVPAPVGQSVFTLVGQPVFTPVGQPVPTAVGQPVPSAVGQSVFTPVGQPVLTPVGQPVITLVGQPVPTAAGQPVFTPVG